MINTDETKNIMQRFYAALDSIIELKRIRGVKTYCDLYKIDRRNLQAQRKDLDRGWFQVSWLTPMVNEYGINAKWLLTGRGKMYDD